MPLCPHTGIDALAATTKVLEAIYAYRDTLKATVSPTKGIGSPQITVGLISGGINTNVVPDRITLRSTAASLRRSSRRRWKRK